MFAICAGCALVLHGLSLAVLEAKLMRRREFIVALAGAAVIWPEVVRAQHSKIWRIGYLDARLLVFDGVEASL
jgi:hypothetical protein